MNAAAAELETMVTAVEPLNEILETYGQCLDLSRNYVALGVAADPDDEVDVDLLQNFLNARADMFAVAEKSFSALSGRVSGDAGEEAERRELTARVVNLLEEMTEVEEQLSTFLGDRLEKMRETIKNMQRAQPVFKRYGHLGGDKIAASRITRRG